MEFVVLYNRQREENNCLCIKDNLISKTEYNKRD